MQRDSKWQPEQSQAGCGSRDFRTCQKIQPRGRTRRSAECAEKSVGGCFARFSGLTMTAKLTDSRDAMRQPRTRTSLKLTNTRPPACGRPELCLGGEGGEGITGTGWG